MDWLSETMNLKPIIQETYETIEGNTEGVVNSGRNSTSKKESEEVEGLTKDFIFSDEEGVSSKAVAKSEGFASAAFQLLF